MIAHVGGAELLFLSAAEQMQLSHEKQPRGSRSAPRGVCAEETVRESLTVPLTGGMYFFFPLLLTKKKTLELILFLLSLF